MKDLLIKKGLDIPIEGKASGQIHPAAPAKEVALDLSSFEEIKFRLLVEEGADVLAGQPLAEDKEQPGRLFVSPASGRVKEIRRGLKRRLLAIVIEVAAEERHLPVEPKNPETASREEIIQHLLANGLFTLIYQRPFGRLANPKLTPRSIFVQALESAPFVPEAGQQIAGFEKEFQYGLNVLRKLTTGQVYLVHRAADAFAPFTGVEHHTVSGPHPAANPSVHIHHIDPIRKQQDVVWTVSTLAVLSIGALFLKGQHHLTRVVAIAGPAVLQDKRQFIRARKGQKIDSLVAGRIDSREPCRLVSGSPLTGDKVEANDYLGFHHTVVSAIPEAMSREMLHFFRLGGEKYSASGAYLSGHLDNSHRTYPFTTSQHGEERAFIDGSIYQHYMPMPVLVMQLIRAIMSEDFELAEELGLLEIVHEDFALPEFVDPCKIPMMEIVKAGLQSYGKDVLG